MTDKKEITDLANITTPELAAIEQSKASKILDTFSPMAKRVREFEDAYNEIISASAFGCDRALVKQARELRLKIKDVRTATEKIRVSEKAECLRLGKAIDGVANIFKWAITDKEENLKEIESFFDRQEKERLQVLQKARAEALSPYIENASEMLLCQMEQDVWEAYFETKKTIHAELVEATRIADALKLEQDKINEAEAEAVRQENEKLKVEAAETKTKEDAKQKELDDANKKIREQKAEAKAIEDKKEAAALKSKVEKEAAIQAELSKNDAGKLQDLRNDLIGAISRHSELGDHAFESDANQKIYDLIQTKVMEAVHLIPPPEEAAAF